VKEGFMRSRISIFLLVGFVVIFCSLPTLAQGEKQKAQAYFALEVVVKPPMIAKYEAAAKEMVSLSSKYNATYPWYGFMADDMHYYFFIPVKNLADVDNMFKEDSALEKKMGEEKLNEIEKLFAGTYEYVHTSMIYSRPDLSYTPESPRLQPEEAIYRHWILYYIQPDKEKEFHEILKKFVDQPKLKNVTDGYEILIGGIGMDAPVCIVALSGKSAADFEAHYEKIWEVLGEEAMALVQKLVAMARGFEIKTAWFRPDLSYIPKEK
jgi:hypothetical protein